MSEDPNETPTAVEAKPAPTLDDVLIALQKAFSRVSAKSRSVEPGDACAMIVGKVNFDLSIRLRPDGDTLRHDPEGDLALSLHGVIHQDVRAEHRDEAEGRQDAPISPEGGPSGSEEKATTRLLPGQYVPVREPMS